MFKETKVFTMFPFVNKISKITDTKLKERRYMDEITKSVETKCNFRVSRIVDSGSSGKCKKALQAGSKTAPAGGGRKMIVLIPQAHGKAFMGNGSILTLMAIC